MLSVAIASYSVSIVRLAPALAAASPGSPSPALTSAMLKDRDSDVSSRAGDDAAEDRGWWEGMEDSARMEERKGGQG
eukprot:814188-Rhodomonas_salina.1